mmetsp:Transcript_15338/g.33159  ORF Transcript_15338/g.33159 Transcript_15338/m.33159 type:complete len:786 (-) Transcript_15338:56-2413(-)
MTSELDDGPAAGSASSESQSGSAPVSGEIPNDASDHAEANGNVRIDFVIDRMLVLSEEGKVRQADVECIGEYCLERVSHESLCLFLVKKTMSFLNDPSKLLGYLKLLSHILDDDCHKITASFHDHLLEHVDGRRTELMMRARSAVLAEREASASAASEQPVNSSTSDDSLELELQEKDKSAASSERNLENPASDDGSDGSKDGIYDDGEDETSAREQKLKAENDAMQNMIAALQAQLQEAKDEILSSKEISSPQEEPNAPDTASTTSQAEREAYAREQKLKDEIIEMKNMVTTLRAELQEARDGRSPPDEVEGDDMHTASLPIDTSLPSDLVEIHSHAAAARSRDGQIAQWKNEVSDFVSSLKTAHRDLRTGARPNRPCNLHAYEFSAPLELISLRVRGWAQGNQPLDGVFDIARDMFDFFECNQDVCEKAEGQSKKANQRIPRGCTLGSMMNVLNESIDAVAAHDTHPMVMEAIRAIGAMKTRADEAIVIDGSTLKKLTKEVGLHQPERSLLNVLLHLVAVVVAVSNKEVSTIANFGGGTDRDKANDLLKVKAAFDDLCPNETWKRCKLSVLLVAIMKFFAGKNLDELRKYRAMEALFIILDERLVRDNEVWEEVDTFSLNTGEPSEKKYFSDGTQLENRRRYYALNYALILLLGNQYGDLIDATDKVVLDTKGNQIQLECDGCESFQLSFLRCSISQLKRFISDKGRVKQHLFSVSTFRRGKIDDGATIESIFEILKQSKKRKNHKTDGFCTMKTILTTLDGSEDSAEEAVSLVTRIAGALHV